MPSRRFTMTIDEDLFERVMEEAEKDKRSIAKQMEYILEQHFQEKDKKKD